MTTMVHDYIIELELYNDEILGRLKFRKYLGVIEESSLYSLPELTRIIALWKANKLLGSFAIGTQLSMDATFQLLEKS